MLQYCSINSDSSCVHQFYANDCICTGELYAWIPSWLGSNYWSWYASRVYDSISNRATKHIGFSADESASQCVGFTADSTSRYHTSITTSGYTYVSTFASKPKQRVDPMADASTTEFGDDAVAQVSYRNPGKQSPSCQWSYLGFLGSCDWFCASRECASRSTATA